MPLNGRRLHRMAAVSRGECFLVVLGLTYFSRFPFRSNTHLRREDDAFDHASREDGAKCCFYIRPQANACTRWLKTALKWGFVEYGWACVTPVTYICQSRLQAKQKTKQYKQLSLTPHLQSS